MSRPDPPGSEDRLQVIYGVHPVQELVEQRPHEVERIWIARERRAGFGRILRDARGAGVPISHVAREILVRKVGVKAAQQGIAAQVTPIAYASADDICAAAGADPQGMLVLLDRVVDPRNLGSILRTSAAAGVRGVLIGAEGSVGLNSTVAKASAGAIERIPVAREARPAGRIDALRERGFEAIVLDPRGESRWDEHDLRGRKLFVAGGEERGVRPAVLTACDRRVSIPMAAGVESLNVAIALGVLLFEAVRQRSGLPDGLETSKDRC